ncbi:helix-turn-helix protein [Tamilnaduibacter salinus]|uniref:Helix-turn-helix protein n=1 Tax=Tamilnaduibacter salinus TaxID=1484056 RepID=A0A2U1CXN1_9GAMM|nr:helix-turn-helix domain-containing protein [Tamilnaduibacter salinus]PVY76876.1 helix-turn-helix protein [Tamilnaduibacter salinus]
MHTPASDNNWLTLQEAASLAQRTTKTLYRWMNRGKLTYEVDRSGRRMIARGELMRRLSQDNVPRPVPSHRDLHCLTREIEALRAQLTRQESLLIEMIELYRPETPEGLRRKRTALGRHNQDGSAQTT